MVMGGSVFRRITAWRFIYVLAVLSACSTEGITLNKPVMGSPEGASVREGSRAGNYLAGQYALTHHELNTASDYLIRALAADPDNLELLQRSFLSLAAAGRLPEAAKIGKNLLKYDGEEGIAALVVAEQAIKHDDWAAAEQVVSHLPSRGINSFMTPLVVAWARVGEGNVDSALEALDPLTKNKSFASLYDFHAALINDLADRRKEAERYYRNTLANNGGLTLRTVDAATAFYRRIGMQDKASEIFDRYLQDHPETALLDRTQAGTRAVNDAKAGVAEAFFGMTGSLRQGRVAELALIFGRLSLDLEPNQPLIQVTVADILQGLGRLEEANQIYLAIPSTSVVAWSARLRVAANLDDSGDAEGAVKTLRDLSAQYPDRPDALIMLGDVLRRHKRWEEAIGAYDRAIAQIAPDDHEQWSLYYSRGIALERSKQWPRAEKDFLHALELQPNDPHVLNYLGYSWIEQGINIERAGKMIEKAVDLRPTDGYIVDSLGWVQYRQGDYHKAVETLRRAVELHPEDPTINAHLGDALWAEGRHEEARFQWQHALASDPEPDLKAELEQKLKNDLTAEDKTITGFSTVVSSDDSENPVKAKEKKNKKIP